MANGDDDEINLEFPKQDVINLLDQRFIIDLTDAIIQAAAEEGYQVKFERVKIPIERPDKVLSDAEVRALGSGWLEDYESGRKTERMFPVPGSPVSVRNTNTGETYDLSGPMELIDHLNDETGTLIEYLSPSESGQGYGKIVVSDRNKTRAWKNWDEGFVLVHPTGRPEWFDTLMDSGLYEKGWIDTVSAFTKEELKAGAVDNIDYFGRNIDEVDFSIQNRSWVFTGGEELSLLSEQWNPAWSPAEEDRPEKVISTEPTPDGMGVVYTYGFSEDEVTKIDTVYPPQWAVTEGVPVKELEEGQAHSYVKDNIRYVWNHGTGSYDVGQVEFPLPPGQKEFRNVNGMEQQWNPSTGRFENTGRERFPLPAGQDEFREMYGMIQQWNPASGIYETVTDAPTPAQPVERLLGSYTDGGWIIDQYGFIDPNTGEQVITEQSEREPIRDPILSLEEMYAQSLAEAATLDMSDPNYARAQALWDFRNQPTSQERLQMALNIAQSPSDYMTLVGLYTGELARENPATVGQRVAPLAPMLQQLAKKFFLNVPGINEDKLTPLPANVTPMKTGVTGQAVSDTEMQDTGQVVGGARQPTPATPQQIVTEAETTEYPVAADAAYVPEGSKGLTIIDEQNRIDGKPYTSKSGIRVGTRVQPDYIPTPESIQAYKEAYESTDPNKMIRMIESAGGMANIQNISTLHDAAMVAGRDVPQHVDTTFGRQPFVAQQGPIAEDRERIPPVSRPVSLQQGPIGEDRDVALQPGPIGEPIDKRLDTINKLATALDNSTTKYSNYRISNHHENFHEGGVVGGVPGQQRTIDVLAGETILTQPQITKLLSMAGITGQTWQPQQGNQFGALTRPATTQIPGQLIGGARPRSLQTMRQMSPTQQRLYKPLVESFGVPYEDYEWQESQISDIGGSRRQRASFRPSSIRGLNG